MFIYYYGFDLIFILTLIITLGAQAFISGKYASTRRIITNKGMTGASIARKILDSNGLSNVTVREVSGELSDRYDPRSKTVNLSSDIYNGSSIASASVASHECGHAIQDKEGYLFLKIRSSIVPLVNFSSYAGYFAILIGLIFSLMDLVFIGIIFEVVILAFQIITLPVEFNASRRALKILESRNILYGNEVNGAKNVLSAAAITYVAAALMSISQLIRLIAISNRNND